MRPLSVSENALAELQSVANWFKTAKVKKQSGSLSKCIDDDRFERLRPALEALGCHQEVEQRLLLGADN